jgi:hypothetical protein
MEKYLPIGTILLLKKATRKVMITGYLPVTEDKKIFRYSGVTYPEGFASPEKLLLFNNSDIAEVNYKGMEDDEQKEFVTKLDEFVVKQQQN